MIDLNPKHLVTIQHILSVHIPECEVRAFGSRVKWTAEDYSDLDLVAIGKKPLGARRMRQLKEAFEESDLPIRVDVLDWHTISDAFKDVIGEEYEVIKDRKSDERCDQPRNSCNNQSITIDESLLKSMPLGSPPSGWNVVRLADVTSFISTGATPRGGKNVYKSEGISLIRSQNVYDHEFSKDGLARIDNSAAYKLRRVNVKEDDVLLNITGDSVARCCIVPKWTLPARVNQHVAIIRTSDRLNSAFLQKYLSTPQVKAYVLGHDSGGTRKALTKAHIESFLVPLPLLFEQRRIANILGSLDDKIELNRQMNETLEATARAIFKSWFVDFDPVRAKMEGREPSGMDAETTDLFPSAFQDSPLGKIPEGWNVERIGNLVEIVKGRSYKSSELTESDIALVTLKSILRGGGYRPDGLKSYNGKFKPEQIITPGELVVSYTDVTQQAEVVGKPAIVRASNEYKTLVASLDLGIIRPLQSTVSARFLYYLFRSYDFQAHINGYATGTTVLHLSKDGVPSYRFALPTDAILRRFDSIVSPLFAKIEANENNSQIVAEIRDVLLPKLLSGEVGVPH